MIYEHELRLFAFCKQYQVPDDKSVLHVKLYNIEGVRISGIIYDQLSSEIELVIDNVWYDWWSLEEI